MEFSLSNFCLRVSHSLSTTPLSYCFIYSVSNVHTHCAPIIVRYKYTLVG